MLTNDQAKLIVDMFGLKDIVEDEEEVSLLDLETRLAYMAIVEMADKN